MKKCIKCGGSFLTRGRIKLSDADICYKCFDALGFDHKTGIYTGSLYKWNDIKDGREALWAREYEAARAKEAAEIGISSKQLHQLREALSTDMEIKIFSKICAVLNDDGRDSDLIDVSAGDNGSLLLMIDGVVFIRYKADSGVKWIVFENESPEKIRIQGAGRINSLAQRIAQAYDFAM